MTPKRTLAAVLTLALTLTAATAGAQQPDSSELPEGLYLPTEQTSSTQANLAGTTGTATSSTSTTGPVSTTSSTGSGRGAGTAGNLADAIATGQDGSAQAYRSLSAAMLDYYAQAEGTNLASFLAANQTTLANSFHTDLGTTTSLQDLNERLLGAGVEIDGVKLAAGADLASVTEGANWAASFTSAPALVMPDVSALAALPDDTLTFGLFYNQTLASFVTASPDIYTLASASGLADGSAQQAWRTAQQAAAGAMTGTGLVAPCAADLVAALGSGSAKGVSGDSGCGSCAVAGAYLHGNMSRLLDPGAQTVLQTDNGSINAIEWDSLADWQQASIQAANPDLEVTGVFGSPNPAAGACQASSDGIDTWLAGNLGGVLASLGG